MITGFFRRNSILLAFFGLCLLVVGLAMLELDKQYYQDRKGQLIRENVRFFLRSQVGDDAIDELERRAVDYLRASGNEERRRELEGWIDELLAREHFIYRIAIRAGEQDLELDAEPSLEPTEEVFMVDRRVDKFDDQHRFSNSLFLSDFSGMIDRPLDTRFGEDRNWRLVIHYTTPLGNPAIEELTRRYRWYALFLLALLSTLAWAAAHSLLLPLRNVLSALEESTPGHTVFIRHPGRRLESFYNRMALDAVIARLQGQLRDRIARRTELTGWEVVRLVCEAFREQADVPLVAALEMAVEGPGRLLPTGRFVSAGQAADDPGALVVRERLELALPADGRDQFVFDLTADRRTLDVHARLLVDPDRANIRYLVALGVHAGSEGWPAGTLDQILERLAALIESGLQTLGMRNRLLVQERGRANISLSRNLGHDLTNIIATSKLELLTLDRLLAGGAPPADERRRAILVESLRGLLRSVRFMQETVNLYRAYAYLQQPAMEMQDGNALVSETLELFSISISGRIQLIPQLAGDAPRCLVDPRLVKLALFNLFTNALDAIRRQPDVADGWIRIATGRGEDGGLLIMVSDSGAGILNPDGSRALPHEIEKIFELGYTNRRDESRGEGLGLNWVRTIVQDLHEGTIVAENTLEGGACFRITFPPPKPAPAEVGMR